MQNELTNVTTMEQALKLQSDLNAAWQHANRSWRNGDTAFNREIVNALAARCNAAAERVREFLPVIEDFYSFA